MLCALTTSPTRSASSQTMALVSTLASPTTTSGSSHSTGLRYVSSSTTVTTTTVAISRVDSTPSNADSRSAEAPAGPVTSTSNPGGAPGCTTSRNASTFAVSVSSSSGSGTTSSIASPSGAGVGGGIAATAREPAAETCAATAARSSSVNPPGRSYTTNAVSAPESRKPSTISRTRVDSAPAGNQAEASLFSTSLRLPVIAVPPTTSASHPTMISQAIPRPGSSVESVSRGRVGARIRCRLSCSHDCGVGGVTSSAVSPYAGASYGAGWGPLVRLRW